MKAFFSILILLSTCSVYAAKPEVFNAVLNSTEISNVQDIQKIEVTQTYRCPNCFDILVSGTNMLGKAFVKVQTHQDVEYDDDGNITGKIIKVKLVESSR